VPPLGVTPSDLRNNPWVRKTRMGLSDRERISMIRSAVLIQITCVTDGRTDRQTDGIGVAYTCYSTYAVARKNAVIKAQPLRALHTVGKLSQRKYELFTYY